MTNQASAGNADGRKIRCGAVGVGRMGRHHARVYADLPDVELVDVPTNSRVAQLRVAGQRSGRPGGAGPTTAAAGSLPGKGTGFFAGLFGGGGATPDIPQVESTPPRLTHDRCTAAPAKPPTRIL